MKGISVKKADITECKNYRAISPSAVGIKLYTRILENRLRIIVDSRIEEAFQKGRAVTDNIFLIRNIIEET